MAKKYYWLKLNQNFFEREEIKVIENMDNGKDYIIFYMKLLLKSIKTEGELKFRDVIPYTPRMLSSITGVNVDTVKVATKMFVDLGLMEQWDDGTLFMVETQNMIGSETESAKRMRKMRERKKLQGKASHSDGDVQKSDIEIEKEKELEKDIDKEGTTSSSFDEIQKGIEEVTSTDDIPDIAKIKRQYEGCGFGFLDMKVMEILVDFSNNYPIEWILKAFDIAVESNKRRLNYVRGILQNWKADGGMKLNKDGDSSGANKQHISENVPGTYKGPDLSHIGYQGGDEEIDDTDLI